MIIKSEIVEKIIYLFFNIDKKFPPLFLKFFMFEKPANIDIVKIISMMIYNRIKTATHKTVNQTHLFNNLNHISVKISTN